ncbi:MAG: AAA family ATPase [Myxococcales bacterium]|nr:AAA family ATPase [Myxococcales bacterium]
MQHVSVNLSTHPPALHHPAVIERYDVQEAVGQGGVAVVYRVVERASGKELALKCMRAFKDPVRARHALEFFEREYHALSQLTHPRVVEVYDYEVGPGGAFYTMEYLGGGDLEGAAPIPYQEACALLRDVCSALCLVHSRRLVHRDISPRNVRRLGPMEAKLIDFGALSPMGPNRQVVGTPPFCPPEVLDREALDARADLYSLGTTLYYALCGRHAYPARDFRHLRQLWKSPPTPPSQLCPEIPATLDALVMELIQLSPGERPDSAAEVMQRLSSIAELPVGEHLTASEAYLVAPTLVGRDRLLSHFRTRLKRAKQGHGRAVAVVASAGLGRSRVLDACALEAKLAGATVVRADRLDAQEGEYGVARALCQQLFELHPQLAREVASPYAAALGWLAEDLAADPEAREGEPGLPPERTQLQRALREFLLAMSQRKPLVLVVDDADRVDEPSTALLALLASLASEQCLTVVTSCKEGDDGDAPASLRMLLQHSKRIALSPLTVAECQQMLGSMFGTPEHLEFVAARLHRVSGGNPRDLMQLAQHLVTRGVARYTEGSWTLPAAIDPVDLPDSLANAMADRVQGLSEGAKVLGRALALAPSDRWNVEQCYVLSSSTSRATTLANLDELVAAGVVDALGDGYGLVQGGWVAPLLADVQPAERRGAHTRIAALFEARDEVFRGAQHRLRAGEDVRALDTLVAYARSSKKATNGDEQTYRRFLANLPDDFEESYKHAISLCEQLGRPAADAYALKTRLCTALPVGPGAWGLLLETLEACERDVGLDLYHQLDPSLDPAVRIRRALKAAEARYEGLGPQGAVFSPTEAVQALAAVSLEGIGIVGNCNDHRGLERLPSLAALAPLVPSFLLADWIQQAIGERLAGRLLSAGRGYERILKRMAEPDQAGLSGTYFTSTRDGILFMRGVLDCAIGAPRTLLVIEALKESELYALGALQLRMVYDLMQGDGVRADAVRRQVECEQVQSNLALRSEGPMLITELTAVAVSDDLTRLRRILPQVERWARRVPSWRPILHYALGEKRRIAGDFRAAMASHRRGLEEARPGEHQLWPLLAGSLVGCLVRLGRVADAVSSGRSYLAQAEAAGVDALSMFIKMPLSVALASHGEKEAAITMARGVVAYFEACGAGGVPVVLARMTEARVCLMAQDPEGFETALQSCAEFFETCTTRSLTATYKQLVRDGRKTVRDLRGTAPSLSDFDIDSQAAVTYLTMAFEGCESSTDRYQTTAKLLAEYCKSEELHLYVPAESGLQLAASIGSDQPPSDFTDMVTEFLQGELGGAGDVTVTASGDDGEQSSDLVWVLEDGRRFRPTLLGHRTEEGFVITGVAVTDLGHGGHAGSHERIASELSRIGLAAETCPHTILPTTQLTDLTAVG